jgi:CRP-like cAMP-binding protein
MSLESTIAQLGRTRPFDSLPREALQLVAFSASEKKLKAGEILFEQGDRADEAYFLLSGMILLTARGDAAERTHLVRSGALIGEAAMLAEIIRPATARATQEARLLTVTRLVFHRVLGEFPKVADQIREQTAKRTKMFVGELEALRLRALS